MRAKIGLLDHAGGGNLGDDASLNAVVGNIKRRLPNAEIVALSMNPEDTKIRHGVISYPIRRNRWSIGQEPVRRDTGLRATAKEMMRNYRIVFGLLKAINAVVRVPRELFLELSFLASSRGIVKSLDLLIISGGGQLTEKDGPWGFPYTIFKWVALASSVGVRSMFLNVGAGPLTLPLSKFFVRRALLAAENVSFRDDKSQALARKIGFAGESRVCPDNVYGLEVAVTSENSPERRLRPVVGFAPMPFPDPDPRGRAKEDQIFYEEFIRKLADFASWLIGQSYTITFFGTDIGVDPVAVEDVQMALLSGHGIAASQYRVSNSVEVNRGPVGHDVRNGLCYYMPISRGRIFAFVKQACSCNSASPEGHRCDGRPRAFELLCRYRRI